MGESAAHTWWIWCFYLLLLCTFANSTNQSLLPRTLTPCCQNLLDLFLYRKSWHAQDWLCSCHKISGRWLSSWYVSISLIATSQSSPPLMMYLDDGDEVEWLLDVVIHSQYGMCISISRTAHNIIYILGRPNAEILVSKNGIFPQIMRGNYLFFWGGGGLKWEKRRRVLYINPESPLPLRPVFALRVKGQ